MQMGIMGRTAPPLRGIEWIDGDGNRREPLSLEDIGTGYRVLYFFQDWCAGCHAHGFPALVEMVQTLADHGVGFAAIQTVFEGSEVNRFDRLRVNQERYGLDIAFGHAAAEGQGGFPVIMEDYRTGGTPWFVVIAPDGRVLFDGFQIDAGKLAGVLERLAA